MIQNAAGATPILIVGGGSPRATIWAVYELVERWGVRYLLDHDALPAKSKFRMPKLNVVMEPIFKCVPTAPPMWISRTVARAGESRTFVR